MDRFKAIVLASALAIPMAAVPVPASAKALVNVQVVNVLNNNEIVKDVNVGIGVAAGIAANVCDVAVNVIAVQLAQGDDVTCTSSAGDQRVDITQR